MVIIAIILTPIGLLSFGTIAGGGGGVYVVVGGGDGGDGGVGAIVSVSR
jgi:hypothetical protein